MPEILLADQSEHYARVVRETVANRFEGLRLDVAHTLDSMQRWIHDAQSGLVFMNVRMDGQLTLDLIEPTKRVNQDITIITVTEYELPEYRRAALAKGADCVIAKQTPLAIEDIAARISAFIGSAYSGS